MDGKSSKTFVVLGDGESQEGSVWEAALFAANHDLRNLTVILDYNKLQASDWLKKISDIDPIEEKWRAFGWNTIRVNGHNHDELLKAFSNVGAEAKPTIIIADTVKGYGISIAENSPDWHSRAPKEDEWLSVCRDIGITFEELERI